MCFDDTITLRFSIVFFGLTKSGYSFLDVGANPHSFSCGSKLLPIGLFWLSFIACSLVTTLPVI